MWRLTTLLENYDVVALQETHGTEVEWQALASKVAKSHVAFFSPLATNAGGVATLVSRKFSEAYGPIEMKVLAEGRAIYVFLGARGQFEAHP